MFTINHIDTLMTATSITVKALKFIGQVLHYTTLLVGAALILAGYWLVTAATHFAGKTQTAADVTEPVHGPVLVEYAVIEPLTAEEYMAGVLSIYSLPTQAERVLDDAITPIAPTKSTRRPRGKKATPIAA